MLSFLVLVALSLAVATLAGHGVHWLLHQRWTGPFYNGHMEHHLELYPPHDLVSPTYKSAKWHHRGPVLFTPAFIVILGAACGLTYLLSIPAWAMVTFGTTMLTFGIASDLVHNAFHIDVSKWSLLPGFARMRELHFVHHRNMRKNFGIIVFAWDKVFGTLKDE